MKKLILILLLVPFVLVEGQQKQNYFSAHANIFSVVFPTRFEQSKQRAGNFLLGGQYNYYVSDMFLLSGGLNFTWLEMNGRNKSTLPTGGLLGNTQFEVLAAYPFLGVSTAISETELFVKMGVSIFGKQNQLGSSKGWVLEGKAFTLVPLEIGANWKFTENWGLSASIMKNFGDKLKIDKKIYVNSPESEIDFLTFNIGLSYAFLSKHNNLQVQIDGLKNKNMQYDHEIDALKKTIEQQKDTIKEKTELLAEYNKQNVDNGNT
ncbi:MAG: outer membrane beta-barrel protein, partial [Ignavibacteriaceae bacterium]|nr:outer membrane beta-barrel protein [Ignavibacteriaceae bacterium]